MARLSARAWGLGVRLRVGNAITTDWPSGHDVILISHVRSAVGRRATAVLARRAFDALPPGGIVLVHDFMVDDAHQGPPFAAWYLLASIVDGVLREAGFAVGGTEVMLPGITRLTRANRPA